jgi:hypothetical protein
MQTPIPNLNGNSKESLITELRTILDALRDADETIGKASAVWHGRNFQTLRDGNAVQVRAQAAWDERRRMLNDFYKEVQDMAIEVSRFI